MASTTTEQDTKRPGGDSPSGIGSPRRAAGEAKTSLAEAQEAVLGDLVTAQLTALEAFERLIARTGPASEDLMNQFSRELMLGLFRLYPVGQELGRHSLGLMTHLAREFSNVLRSALPGVDGQGASRSRAVGDGAADPTSVPG